MPFLEEYNYYCNISATRIKINTSVYYYFITINIKKIIVLILKPFNLKSYCEKVQKINLTRRKSVVYTLARLRTSGLVSTS